MDKAQLLSEFKTRVDKFEKFQSFIEKAKSQAGKFAAAVVEKVIQDNQEKSLEVVGELIPLTADMESVIADLGSERAQVLAGAQDSQFKLEELELRHAIGDLADAEFEAESREYKSVVQSTDTRVAAIDAELGQLSAILEHWTELAIASGVFEPGDSGGEEPLEALDAIDEVIPEEDGEAAPDDAGGDDRGGGRVIEDDVGIVFESSSGQMDGFDAGDLDILQDEEIDLEGGEGEASKDDDKPRRAVLLYQEGTAEEQIYPFTGEILSLGRGRDNDVQVKNDSKVSRYHCKMYRRGPNFYIEDNKSANGTLVNGELITERRLFGGEEVIIGETFFRFRILD